MMNLLSDFVLLDLFACIGENILRWRGGKYGTGTGTGTGIGN